MRKAQIIIWGAVIGMWLFMGGQKLYYYFHPREYVECTVRFQNIDDLLRENPNDPDLLQTRSNLEALAKQFIPIIESNIAAEEARQASNGLKK